MQTALLQIQTDVTGKLAVELASWGVNVKSLRKLILSNELDGALLAMTDVGGKHGCGVAVEMPEFGVDEPNAPGPQGTTRIAVLVVENPTENLSSNGTQRSAEEVARRVLNILHLWMMKGIGLLYAQGQNVIAPTDEIEGHVCYRVSFQMKTGDEAMAITQVPAISGTPTAVTINNGTGHEAASIYYTIDGESFPGPDQPNSFLYSAPFSVDSGTLVRAAAYLTGYIGSDVTESTITTA